MNRSYGQLPVLMGNFILTPSEMCFVQYLPIKMASSDGLTTEIRVPRNLQWVMPLIEALGDIGEDEYLYLTAKYLYVSPDNMGNRPGWHSDGFGTDDLNYIWTDSFPTEFCIQDFNLSTDCSISMVEMDEQAEDANIIKFNSFDFLKLDKYVIHRSPEGTGYRAFVKLSVSTSRYNLKGNAHNYLFDYEWPMVQRKIERNHPNQ